MRSPENTTPTILQTSFWLNASIRNQCCCGQCMLPRHRHTNATAAAATIVTSEQWNWIFCLICLGCSRTEACARCVWTMLLAVLLQNKRGNLCAVHVLVGKNAIWTTKGCSPLYRMERDCSVAMPLPKNYKTPVGKKRQTDTHVHVQQTHSSDGKSAVTEFNI